MCRICSRHGYHYNTYATYAKFRSVSGTLLKIAYASRAGISDAGYNY